MQPKQLKAWSADLNGPAFARRAAGTENVAKAIPPGADASQTVTVKDLEAGRIRFPRPAKRLFPADRTRDQT